MSVPNYSQYKDSGVEWLGLIPQHWDIDRFKWSIASAKNGVWGDERQGDRNDIICIRVADFDRIRLAVDLPDPTIRNIRLSDRIGRVVVKGDLLLEKSGGGENQPVGAVVIYDGEEPAVCSNFVARLEIAKEMEPRFWCYVHAAAYAVRLTVPSIKQTSGIQNLDQGAYLDERSPFPPLNEQTAIATFLDRETAKIDELVEEQRRLIALLKEKRQAVISHAVTKGLDPNAPMKDSCVEWLGEVPAHWELTQVGRLCSALSYGFTNPMPTADDGPFMLTANDIGYGEIAYATARRTTSEAFNTLLTDKSRPQAGDVLVTKDGTLGRIAIHDGQTACINQSVAFLRADEGIVSPQFLATALMEGVYQERMIYEAGGTTIKHIYISRLAKMPIALPPRDEMDRIVKACERYLYDFGALMREAVNAINLLQERRAALISAAVTGKIDVRGLVTMSETQAAA